MPPRWLRLAVITPAVPTLALLVATTLPLTAMAAAALSPLIPGRWRPLRLLLFVLVWLGIESLAIVALVAMWCARRIGFLRDPARWRSAHYRLMRGYLAGLVHVADKAFRLSVDIAPTATSAMGGPIPARGSSDGPLIVLSRHAGPGDSFLIVHELLAAGWRPRIVLREDLRWLPAIDIAFGRLPTGFVARRAARGEGQRMVARLASDLDAADALVIFPEGRNFTPKRRQHSIERLEELGRHDEAEAARQMRHVLFPRTAGPLAAIRAAPRADVVFVAHTGLESLSGVADLWRGLPMDGQVRIASWVVARRDVPTEAGDGEAWLHGWWRRIDRWLIDHHGRDAVPEVIAEAFSDDDGGTAPR